jgi:hypothetical protein
MLRVVLFLLLGSVSPFVHSNPDISIFISRAYAEQITVKAIESHVSISVPLTWNAQVHVLTEQSVHIRAEGVFTDRVVAILSFDLLLDCGRDAPEGYAVNVCNPDSYVYIVPSNFNVSTVTEVLSEAQEQEIINEINNGFANISSEISCCLSDGFRWVNIASVCPTIKVSNQSDITATIDFIHGCINGKVRKIPCTGFSSGPGKIYQCGNGKWRYLSGYCISDSYKTPTGNSL